jgi:hypothetical protein
VRWPICTFDAVVAGSSPARLTNYFNKLERCAQQKLAFGVIFRMLAAGVLDNLHQVNRPHENVYSVSFLGRLHLRGRQIIGRPAGEHHNLKARRDVPDQISQRRHSVSVALGELIVENDHAAELFGQSKAKDNRELVARPYGQRPYGTAFASDLNRVGLKVWTEGNFPVSAAGEIAKPLQDRSESLRGAAESGRANRRALSNARKRKNGRCLQG